MGRSLLVQIIAALSAIIIFTDAFLPNAQRQAFSTRTLHRGSIFLKASSQSTSSGS
jgi:hypothetical protein